MLITEYFAWMCAAGLDPDKNIFPNIYGKIDKYDLLDPFILTDSVWEETCLIQLRKDGKNLYELEWRKPDKQDIGKMCWFWNRSALSQTELDGVRLHLIKANPDFKGLLADHGQIAPTEQDFIKVYGG